MSSLRRAMPHVTGVWTLLVLLFLLVPLATVVLFSFHASQGLTLPFEGFSLRWYDTVLADPELKAAARNSLLVSCAVTVATFVLGTATAYGLSRARVRGRGMIVAILLTPLAVPGLFIGASLLASYDRVGLELSLLTVGLAQFVFVFPLFFVMAQIAFQRLDPATEEAAADLGASPWQTFRRVTFQQVSPILIGASALVFMVSFDEFLMTNFVVGVDQTVPTLVFQRIRRTIDPTSNVISSLLLLITISISLLALAGALLAERRRGRSLDAIQGLG